MASGACRGWRGAGATQPGTCRISHNGQGQEIQGRVSPTSHQLWDSNRPLAPMFAEPQRVRGEVCALYQE